MFGDCHLPGLVLDANDAEIMLAVRVVVRRERVEDLERLSTLGGYRSQPVQALFSAGRRRCRRPTMKRAGAASASVSETSNSTPPHGGLTLSRLFALFRPLLWHSLALCASDDAPGDFGRVR